MPIFQLDVNGKNVEVNAPGEMPLLWALRDLLHLKGTKYGCGLGICGICTIHLDGKATRSCLMPIEEAIGQKITTIEGLSKNGNHPVQQAWQEANVPQCGYCQPGQIMQAVAMFSENQNPEKEEIETSMSSILCRCGTYPRIKKAIELAKEKMKNHESN